MSVGTYIGTNNTISAIVLMSLFLIMTVATVQYIHTFLPSLESFQNPDKSQDFRSQAAYTQQMAAIATRYKGVSGKRRAIQKSQIPEDEQCLVNYTALGCRITGYIGPFLDGYLDPVNAVSLAAQIGCSVFVPDIDIS